MLEAANDYGLKVAGLKPGKYEVSLGDKKVAEYSAEELAKGVNLAGPALAAGPVADQVKAVKAGDRSQEQVLSRQDLPRHHTGKRQSARLAGHQHDGGRDRIEEASSPG